MPYPAASEFTDRRQRVKLLMEKFNALVDELVARLQEQAIIRPANINRFLEAAVDAAQELNADALAGSRR